VNLRGYKSWLVVGVSARGSRVQIPGANKSPKVRGRDSSSFFICKESFTEESVDSSKPAKKEVSTSTKPA
jgi:hypothetical protein